MSPYNHRYFTCIIFIFLFGIKSLPAAAQTLTNESSSESFVKWAKANAFSLQNIEPETGNVDLKPLKTMVGDARVVALGEASHGMHAIISFRNRLFKYMAEELGFTAIVLESGLAESQQLADYIAGGPFPQLVANRNIGSLSSEDKELFNWMREYNLKPEHKNKLKFYGMDMQIIGYPGDTVSRHAGIDQALTYLKGVDQVSATALASRLNPYLPRLSNAKYPLFSPQEHDQLSAALDDMIALFERQRITFLGISSKYEYEWAYRNAIVARQTDRIARVTPPDPPGKIPADAWKVMNARDGAMAENVKWILEQEGVGSKVMLFSHNAHVKNAVTTGGVWDAFAIPPNAAGQYLRSALGNKLLIIGSSFPSEAPAQPHSLDVALAQVGLPRFILDLRTASSNRQVNAWLSTTRPMQANMHTFLNLPANTAFDALVFIDKPEGVKKN